MPLADDGGRPVSALGVLLDASHLDAAETSVWQHNAVRFFVIALSLSIIVVVVRPSVSRPLSAMADWGKGLKTGRVVSPPMSGTRGCSARSRSR